MPKLYSSKEIDYVLRKNGYSLVTQKGSHGKFKNRDGNITVLPMNKKEIPIGTFRSILKQSKISLSEFERIFNG